MKFVSKFDADNCEIGFPDFCKLAEPSEFQIFKSYDRLIQERCEYCFTSAEGYLED
jgi:hypothetical protein